MGAVCGPPPGDQCERVQISADTAAARPDPQPCLPPLQMARLKSGHVLLPTSRDRGDTASVWEPSAGHLLATNASVCRSVRTPPPHALTLSHAFRLSRWRDSKADTSCCPLAGTAGTLPVYGSRLRATSWRPMRACADQRGRRSRTP